MKKLYILFLLILFSNLINSQSYQWAKNFSDTSYNSTQSVKVDAAGNVFTAGFFYSTTDFDPGLGTFTLASTGNADIFMSKLDANGNFLWVKSIGGTFQDMARSSFIDASGNIYITGCFYGTVDFDPGPGVFNMSSPLLSAASINAFVAKYDFNGNFIWAKSFYANASDARQVYVDGGGNVYTIGTFDTSADLDPGASSFSVTAVGNRDFFISKLDAAGNFIWAKNFGSAGNYNYGNSIIADPLGNVYATGVFLNTVDFDPGPGTNTITSTGNYDVFILKLDVSGNYIWAKSVGSSLSDQSSSLEIDASGNIYISGYFVGTVDFDPGASVTNRVSIGGFDAFLLKLDNNGNFILANSIGGAFDDYFSDIVLDANKNIYATGSFASTVDFDGGPGTNTISTQGFTDAFILKIDSSTNFIWARSMGGTSYDYGYSIDINAIGDLYATGIFSLTANFDLPAITATLSSPNGNDGYIAKYKTSNVGVQEISSKENLFMYPNPCSQRIYFSRIVKQAKIFDSNGKHIAEESYTSSIDISSLPNGIYFIRIKTDKGEFNKKFIKN
ncbi:MAG: T9SS type A sorting domain-containing protein [Sphingobacteriaceae bacterium]|nr:T9SS type A sorting domain-containing protein [Sphingobacteriaceae bacterium]